MPSRYAGCFTTFGEQAKGATMSISMENFASHGHFAKFDPHSSASPRMAVMTVQCRCCGFEPECAITPPRVCPKCHSQSW
jgi:predicted Zn-ribbon and HTH transcriptional regulator